MRRLCHALRLVRELAAFSIVNRVWWPFSVVLLLLLTGAVMTTVEVTAPFTVYTLF